MKILKISEIPDKIRSLVVEAREICQARGVNLILIGHIFEAALRRFPNLADIISPHGSGALLYARMMESLKQESVVGDGRCMFIDIETMNFLEKLSWTADVENKNFPDRLVMTAIAFLPGLFSEKKSEKTEQLNTHIKLNSSEQQVEFFEKQPVSLNFNSPENFNSSLKVEKHESVIDEASLSIPFTIEPELSKLTGMSFIGRQNEKAAIFRILLRMKDPAVVVIGDPGTGKTTLLRGIALDILQGNIPPLSEMHIYELDTLAILSGINQRTFSSATLIEMLGRIRSRERAILFVDNFHLIIGQDGMPLVNDLSACFKPFLADSTIRVVFTTIPREYDTVLSRDSIFAHHVSPLYLDELDGELLLEAVRKSSPSIALKHGLNITDEAISRSIELGALRTSQYRPPGSCLRLLDDATALALASGEKSVTAFHVEEVSRSVSENNTFPFKSRLAQLEEELAKNVKSQEEAIKTVARRVRLTKLKMDHKPTRPDGVFLFLGPSGVGKTELAKSLTVALYGDMNRLIRLDMSEYMEKHEYSKLIGAPPGYLGYGEEGHLTGPVSRLGHGVILLDEIEKAHRNILNTFLQVFDEGWLTDGKGKKVDFSQFVIIMTSNMAHELWQKTGGPIGFKHGTEDPEKNTGTGLSREALIAHLRKYLSSEFLNRIDDIVLFRPLSKKDLVLIAIKNMEEEVARWARFGKKITYDSDFIEMIVQTGYNPELGARHLMRNLERMFSQPLADAAMKPEWAGIKNINVKVRAGETVFTFE